MSKKASKKKVSAAATSSGVSHEKPPDQPWFIPNDEEQSVYRFIIAASKRARQLQAGTRPSISTVSNKPTKIGMEEVKNAGIEVEIIADDHSEDPGEEPII